MMRVLVFAALCAFGSTYPIDDMVLSDAGGCEAGWKYLNKNCYFPTANLLSWDDAKTDCENNGAVLAVVKNEQQNADVLSTQIGLGHFAYWIGVKENNGQLELTDGSASTYTNWAKDSDKPSPGKECVTAAKIPFGVPLGSWQAKGCGSPLPYTCSKRAAELAAPTLTYKTPLPQTPGITMVCNIDFPKGLDANFDVEWYANGQLVKTDRVQGKNDRESYLKSGHNWEASENEFKAGDTLQCKVKACLGNTCTPQGAQETSNDYFVGMRIEPKNYFEMDECSQKSIKVTLVPTVPIRCTADALSNCNDFETEYGVSVPVEHDPKVKVTDCTADFGQNENPDESKIDLEIVPVCDNINGNGDEFKVHFKEITSTHPFWKGYKPGSVTIKVTDKNTPIHQCYCNDDPHCKTLDGRAYNYYGVGTFVMYRNNRGNNEVHIKTRKCNNFASCTCAVAVRFNGVSVVMDACNKPMNYVIKPAHATLPKGMHVTRNCGGNTCRMVVITPNGNKVTFHKSGPWHQLYVDAHLEQGACQTEGEGKHCGGLCGKYNGNWGDDFYTSYGTTSGVQDFGNSWRINDGDSYFNKDPEPVEQTDDNNPLPEQTCNCNIQPPECEFNFNDIFDPINEGAEDINEELEEGWNRRRRSVSPMLITHERQTRSTITRQEATDMCDKAIFKSAVGNACLKLVGFKDRMNTMLENCIFDVQASEDPTVVDSTVNTLTDSCLFEAVSDPANHVNGKIPTDILDNICEGDCSGHGTCKKGKCACDTDYVSRDCSISIKKAPLLEKNKIHLCDISVHKCKTGTVVGSGFHNSLDLTCHLEKNILIGSGTKKTEKTTGKQIGVYQVRCEMPTVTTPTKIDTVISNNGVLKSIEHTSFIIYNSKCEQCNDATGTCSVKANMCSINGECFNANDKNPQNTEEACKPDKDQASWTGPDAGGPKFKLIDCFNDARDPKPRALSILLKNLRKEIQWGKMSLTINECARLALENKFKYFAIQYYGECWSDENAKASKNYNMYGKADASKVWKIDGEFSVGGDHVNCVYEYM